MRLTSEICGVLNMNVLLFLEFGDLLANIIHYVNGFGMLSQSLPFI